MIYEDKGLTVDVIKDGEVYRWYVRSELMIVLSSGTADTLQEAKEAAKTTPILGGDE